MVGRGSQAQLTSGGPQARVGGAWRVSMDLHHLTLKKYACYDIPQRVCGQILWINNLSYGEWRQDL
jgi:hypothetical protein